MSTFVDVDVPIKAFLQLSEKSKASTASNERASELLLGQPIPFIKEQAYVPIILL